METHFVYPTVFALALLLIGLGSAFYHASLTLTGQFLDVFGMYLIATFVLVYNVGRLRVVGPVPTVTMYVILNIALAALLYEIPAFRRFMFAIVLIAALALEYPIRRRVHPQLDSKLLWSAVATLAMAFVVWVLDITRVLCAPESRLQGHAVWHVAGAASTWLLYLYYYSEGRQSAAGAPQRS